MGAPTNPPTPEPSPSPTPEPSVPCPSPPPVVGCARFCGMQDVVEGKKKNCKFLKQMDTLCEMSYVSKGSQVVPCEMDPKKQKCVDSKQLEECDLKAICGARRLETGHSQDEDHESGEEDTEDEDLEERSGTQAEAELATKSKTKEFLHSSSVVFP